MSERQEWKLGKPSSNILNYYLCRQLKGGGMEVFMKKLLYAELMRLMQRMQDCQNSHFRYGDA